MAHTTVAGGARATKPVVADPVLNNNSWETISKISRAGKAAKYWNIGDTKDIVINGKVGNSTFTNLTVQAFIIGIDHNAAMEGQHLIHFQIGKISNVLVGFVDSKYGSYVSTAGYFTMNTSEANSGGWESSHMRKTILGSDCASADNPTANTLLAALPSDLRAVMKAATKYSDNTGGGSDTASYVTATQDLLPLLAEFEFRGNRWRANSAEQNYQAQYDYYKAGNSKAVHKHNAISTAVQAWFRSVSATSGSSFCYVGTDEDTYANFAYESMATAPCFFV